MYSGTQMYLTEKLYWDSLTHLLFLYLLFRTSPLLNLFLLLRLTSFQENVHFHTFSTPLFTKGGSKLSYSNVTIHFLVLTYFATIYLILTPIQLPSTFKKMSDKVYWKRFCEYLRIRKRKTSSHILCMYVYLLLSTYYLSVIRQNFICELNHNMKSYHQVTKVRILHS